MTPLEKNNRASPSVQGNRRAARSLRAPLDEVGAVNRMADVVCVTLQQPPGSLPADQPASTRQAKTLAEKWLGYVPSVFSFASADLEAAYHKYLLGTVTWPATGLCLAMIFAWLAVFQKLYYATAATFGYPKLLNMLLAGSLNLAPMCALIAVIAFSPGLYTRNYNAVNLFVQVSSLVVSNKVRSCLFWACTIAGSAPTTVRAFMVENLFLTQSLRVLFLPSSQACDFAIVTTILLLHLSGNKDMCEKWGSKMVTLSPPVVRISQWLSDGVLASLGSVALWSPGGLPRLQSCTTVLAFWQVVGWWAAGTLVLLQEVVRRRAFLASNPRLRGPRFSLAKKRWPLGSPVHLTKCIAVVMGKYIVAALMWAAYVSVYP